jgi:hydroxymethylglutaryl-CoA lyase
MSDIRIVEVGPRDGLQTEKAFIPTDAKIAFVDALSESGLSEIEVSSFVSPKWVPQLSDAAEVFAGIQRRTGVTYSALVPNEIGLERAVAARVDKVAVFTAASETFSRKNTNASIVESVERFQPIVRDSPVQIRAYVSTAFHCPYEGRIEPSQVLEVCDLLSNIGVSELSIGDTIGRATPQEVEQLLELLLRSYEAEAIAMHFHDTFGRAADNAIRSEQMGIRIFDSSAGGIGGCPFAPGAPGNVSTGALIATFEGRTGVDLQAIEHAADLIRPHLGTRLPPEIEL